MFKNFHVRLGTRQGCQFSLFILTWNWKSQPEQPDMKNVWKASELKRKEQIGKKKKKVKCIETLFSDDIILYKENPKYSVKKTVRSNQ